MRSPNEPTRDAAYRHDIDGLRAIAVGSVLLFHAELPGFSGGFVGVDVFFVISGFLITSIIQRDLNYGRFSITSFYERRVRRIFPAFFSMLVVVIAVGYVLFDATDFARLGRNVAAATAFVSNVVFWRETGYFAPAAATNPLLHTWSLAVEEQFYLFFPLFMALAFRFGRAALVTAVIFGTIVSFVLSAYGAFHYQGATFYLLPPGRGS